jgi:Rad3-related DNA helicase
MTEDERRDFLQRFEESSDEKSLIGFCVLGGIFSEGIDLRQDRLIGAMIVGTGFPKVCAERELLKHYFDGQGENGFDYAYRFPGMNKVLQAAGRVIRTAEDVGIVVLMDDRFCTNTYQRLFPAEWRDSRQTDSARIGDKISRFWDEWL